MTEEEERQARWMLASYPQPGDHDADWDHPVSSMVARLMELADSERAEDEG